MTLDPDLAWNEPTQKRSREKVARILDAARQHVVQTGALDLKMTEIAKASGVAIGTLYQFFPSRTALLGKLFSDEMAPIDKSLQEMMARITDASAISDEIRRLMETHLDIVRQRPALLVIWSSSGVDPIIQAADFENTCRNARYLTHQIASLHPGPADLDELETSALLVCHLWGSVIRLCVLSSEAQSKRMIGQYTKMISALLRS